MSAAIPFIGAALAALLASAEVLSAPAAPCILADAISSQMARGDYSALNSRQSACPFRGNPELVRAMLAAARLDSATALAAVDRYRRSGDADPNRRAIAAGVEADVAFIAGRFGRATSAASEHARLLSAAGDEDGAAAATQTAAVARLLSDQPAQRRTGGMAVPTSTSTDAAGLTRASVKFDRLTESMVLDTGANLSVLSASAAKRLGVRLVEGTASVGSSTREAVPVRLGIAPALTIGGIHYANVAFLVLDDGKLTFPKGYKIEGIIGLPVFLQAGGLTVYRRGEMILAAPSLGRAISAPLRANGSALIVDAAIDGRPLAMHLDTGANRTDFIRHFRDRYPDLAPAAAERSIRRAGAGGATTRKAVTLKKVSLAFEGGAVSLAEIALDLEDPGPSAPWLGILGQDVLRRGSWYGLDFDHKRLILSEDAVLTTSTRSVKPT